jgi:hypothetical protein
MLMDVFNNRLFAAVEMTAMMEEINYVPDLLGSFGERLFNTKRVRTRQVAIAKRQNHFTLIPTSPIGAPPVQLELAPGDIRDFRTRRLAKSSTLYAEEMNGVLNAPDSLILKTVQQELAERGAQLRTDQEITEEHMRFGAVFGKVLDADGVTVLDDWFANWGVAEPTPFNFHLNVATTNVRAAIKQVLRTIRVNSKGAYIRGQTEIHALCGPTFFDQLTGHANVEKWWLNWQASADMRGETADDFDFGGVIFHDFRGSDDGTTMTVADDEAQFFPIGARDTFQRVMGPGEFEPFIQEPGRDIYSLTIPDRDRGAFTKLENYVYPLYVCTRPAMLQKAVAS